jgi:hypothetical protein
MHLIQGNLDARFRAVEDKPFVFDGLISGERGGWPPNFGVRSTTCRQPQPVRHTECRRWHKFWQLTTSNPGICPKNGETAPTIRDGIRV